MRKPRLETQRKKAVLKKIYLALGIFVGFFVVLIFVSRLDSLQIQNISIRGNTVIDQEDLLRTSQDVLGGHYLLFFPKSNIFLYPKVSLEKYLKEKHPRIKELSIVPIDMRSFSILVEEKTPTALWCSGQFEEFSLENQIENCFLLDKNGFIFAKFSGQTEPAFIKFFGKTNFGKDIGDTYIIEEGIEDTISFTQKIEEGTKKKVSVFSDGEDGSRKVVLDTGTVVIFDNTQKYGKIVKLLELSILKIDEEGKEIGQLGYIDLRFGNKIFYK